MPSSTDIIRAPRRSKFLRSAALLAIVYVWAKRAYPKAALSWLLKRLLGALLARVVPIPIPELRSGKASLKALGSALKVRGCKRPLIVTDEMLVKNGLVQKCIDSIQDVGCEYEVFDKVVPNPHADLVEEGSIMYSAKKCDSIVAFGGGSPMDAAKMIGVKTSNPLPMKEYAGFFRATLFGLRPIPPLVAVPTTAGTGSENTMVAIITLPEESRKIMVGDPGIVPHMAILDPEVVKVLPGPVTAATGMDALTHAVESYLSGWSTGFTRDLSLKSVERIFQYLEVSYRDGSDLKAREEMLRASSDAGVVLTRANVGYVHAIAHQLGGMFHTPHGDANAMLMPHVLEFYLADEAAKSFRACHCADMLCELAVAGRLAESVPVDREAKRKLASSFVAKIRAMSANMKIAVDVHNMKPEDVPEVARRALAEAHGEIYSVLADPLRWAFDLGYPTPRYMTHAECEQIIRKVLLQTAA